MLTRPCTVITLANDAVDTAVIAVTVTMRVESPGLAEILLRSFIRAKEIEAIVGDLEEDFRRNCASGMSGRRASYRYWGQVLSSIGPQMWQALKRVGWAGLIAAVSAFFNHWR
jgi:hypothetical protein